MRFLYVLELVVVDFLAEGVLDCVELVFVDVYVFGWDELVVGIVQDSYVVAEVGNFALVILLLNVLELY